MARVAFLGLGVMGYPMAGHLEAAGHDVCVYNRSSGKSANWAEDHKGTAAPTPREAAEGADFVMSCVGNDDDLRSVCVHKTDTFFCSPSFSLLTCSDSPSSTKKVSWYLLLRVMKEDMVLLAAVSHVKM